MASKSNYVPVEQFYRGKSVFVTGGTGFLGKLLVEKLLWSCPGIEQVYLLIRPNKHGDVAQRLKLLLSSPAFDRVRKRQPLDLLKVIPVEGELSKPLLGISERDQAVLSQKISVVFHAAATVKFDADLRTAVDINVVGTKNVIKTCHLMPKLEAFVHISTAYCNCDHQLIKEEVYPASHDLKGIIESVQIMDDHTLEKLTPKLLGNRPNTYTFTKALAENMLVRESTGLPLAIVRPSTVMASMKDPVPGWIESWFGPTPLVVGIANGTLRTVLCHENMAADLIPVDMVVNLTICAAWRTATNKLNGSSIVYNCCSSEQNPITWKQFAHYLYSNTTKYPLRNVLLCPRMFFITQTTLYFLFTLVFETMPAYVLDIMYRVAGRKPIFVQIHQRLKKVKQVLHYFTTHQWCFKDDNVRDLNNSLQTEDRKTFSFDVKDIDWPSYLQTYYLGIRHFLLKEK